MSAFLLIFGLIAFVGLVVVHEWGHFIAARKAKVDVEEFGIGFPPKAKTITVKNGTEYTLNWLPLGGFVRLKGEHDADTDKGSFGAAKLSDKVKIMVAGVFMNLITALVLFTLVALIGMPKLVDNQFTVDSDTKIIKEVENQNVVLVREISEESPAAKIGISTGDELLSIDGIELDNPEQLPSIVEQRSGKEVQIVFKDNTGNIQTKEIKLADSRPYIGIAPYSGETGVEVRRSTWSAPIVAVGLIKDFTILTFKGLGTAVKGLGSIFAGIFTGNNEARKNGQSKATEQVGGPLAIFAVLKEGSKLGISFILTIIALISLTLAIMNILPIPALDGGRLFVTLLFRALRKPLTPEMEDRIHGTGMVVLLILFALITVVDIRRIAN
jgi:regulator of sigma E protease